jgi:methyl-accepting chemotaxis protein
MNNKGFYKRRNIFIKKRFQTDFSIKFLILIAIESLMAIGLFIYISKGTITAGYSGSELIVARTRDFFLPTLLLSNLIIVGLTAFVGVVVLLLASHKIAGPLYRFEESLVKIGDGDLTYRLALRGKDQMNLLAERINELNSKMEEVISTIQQKLDDMEKLFSEIQSSLSPDSYNKRELEDLINEASKKVNELKKTSNYFRTSRTQGKRMSK